MNTMYPIDPSNALKLPFRIIGCAPASYIIEMIDRENFGKICFISHKNYFEIYANPDLEYDIIPSMDNRTGREYSWFCVKRVIYDLGFTKKKHNSPKY